MAEDKEREERKSEDEGKGKPVDQHEDTEAGSAEGVEGENTIHPDPLHSLHVVDACHLALTDIKFSLVYYHTIMGHVASMGHTCTHCTHTQEESEVLVERND
jgi:hypothetical protein